jgi:hypothetical protein
MPGMRRRRDDSDWDFAWFWRARWESWLMIGLIVIAAFIFFVGDMVIQFVKSQ